MTEDTTAKAASKPSLWKRRGYVTYLGSQTVAQLGFQVSVVAIPLIAVLELDASPVELGLLVAAERVPFLIFALMAGVLVDRFSRRRLLIYASILRAPLVLTIPVAAAMGWMTVTQLYVVAFLLGTLTVLSDVAALSIMPSLVPKDFLAGANAKLEAARSASEVVGPGLGGALVQFITAPFALVVDAVSFLVSGAMLSALPKDEDPKEKAESGKQSAWQDIKEGIAFVWRTDVLRWNAVVAGLTNLFAYAFLAIQFLFIIDDLQLGAVFVGVLLSLGGVGGVLGALAAGWISNRLGIGTGFLSGSVTMAAGVLLVGLAPAGMGFGLVLAGSGYFLFVCGIPIFNVAAVTIRQAVTPAPLLGRTNATMRFLIWGSIPLGSLIGGVVAEATSSRAVVLLTGAALLIPTVLLVLSPIRGLRITENQDQP
ncbi:MFS family permease [Saccharothrix ecbatanensis]|uniref:MFS family permease n=1 Tax=Saccharothrix ecbatanensis TaxID=1105145 RepID=A0A7W9M0K6_9PSEU|nr:MFS transporter [Saccharothrix ecbatanensis]MBB5802961.1 MFS family permease [Saccharothrix ecbatanensis]